MTMRHPDLLVMTMRRPDLLFVASVLASVLTASCASPPHAPEAPTWADVEPIMRAQCNHCHGATARKTGAVGALVYRFDFYDMTEAMCGEAAAGMENGQGQQMARGWSALIKSSIVPRDGARARMPPAPAAPLADWQRDTLLRWADQPFPPRGAPGRENRRPQIRLSVPNSANGRLSVIAVVDDPDGESVVGVLKLGGLTMKMDRAGSFGATLDTSGWPDGRYPFSAVLCDGWGSTSYRLGSVEVLHGDPEGPTQVVLYGPISSGTTPAPEVGVGGSGGGGAGGGADASVARDAAKEGAGGPVAGKGGAGGFASGTGGTGGLADAGPRGDATPGDARAPGMCPDSDKNGVTDCAENLVKNGDLSVDLTGWIAQPYTTQDFILEDALGDPQSGSIAVTSTNMIDMDGLSMVGPRQCVATAASAFDVRAQVFVRSILATAQAAVNVPFFATADCSGSQITSYTSPLVSGQGAWQLTKGTMTAPAGSKSMSVRLVVIKPFKQPALKVLFDNVLLRAKDP